MNVQEVMQELENFGNEQTKKTFLRHGAREPFFGVKVQDLKKILKKTKKNHELSLALYDTGNSDAMYLAGLMADEKKISKEDLQQWVEKAYWFMISECTVAWLAAESPHGYELGLEWIESDTERIASAGWATLANHAQLTVDENLDIDQYEQLLERVEQHIHESPNRVRYVMNGFVISVAGAVKPLHKKARQVANKIGKVEVNMGNTACKVPLADAYIQKIVDRGSVGKKKKKARC